MRGRPDPLQPVPEVQRLVLAVGVAVRIGVDVVVRIGGRVAPQAGQLRIERVGAAPDLDLITDRGDDRVVEAAV